MKKFLLGIAFALALLLGIFLGCSKDTKTTGSDKTFHQIDSIFIERDHYLLDTVKTKVTVINTVHETATVYVDKVFAGTDSGKIALFDSIYPKKDTVKLMEITDSQAKAAIEERYNHQKDSSLMVVYKKSADDCDERIKTVKGKIDTVKVQVKAEVDSAHSEGLTTGIKVGLITVVLVIVSAITYIQASGTK